MLLYVFGLLLVHGTVTGVIGILVGFGTWLGMHWGLNPVAAAGTAGAAAATLAMALGEFFARYLRRQDDADTETP